MPSDRMTNPVPTPRPDSPPRGLGWNRLVVTLTTAGRTASTTCTMGSREGSATPTSTAAGELRTGTRSTTVRVQAVTARAATAISGTMARFMLTSVPSRENLEAIRRRPDRRSRKTGGAGQQPGLLHQADDRFVPFDRDEVDARHAPHLPELFHDLERDP